jgi:hypothetical protein
MFGALLNTMTTAGAIIRKHDRINQPGRPNHCKLATPTKKMSPGQTINRWHTYITEPGGPSINWEIQIAKP